METSNNVSQDVIELAVMSPTSTQAIDKKSLHKRRYDAKQSVLPEHLTVLSPRSDGDGKEVSPGPSAVRTPLDFQWIGTDDSSSRELENICDIMRQKLQNKNDTLSRKSIDIAINTKSTMEAVDHLSKLYKLMEELLTLKQQKERMLRRTRDIEFLKNIQAMRRQVEIEIAKVEMEDKEINIQNEAMEAELAVEFSEKQLQDEASSFGGSLKRRSSRWKPQKSSKTRGSLLRKERSRSVGGEELGTTLDRLSISPKSPKHISDKKKVSNWTKVKAAFKWEKAASGTSLGHELVSGGVLVGMVALASTSSPPHSAPPALEFQSAPRTPSTTPHTPCSSLEELRLDYGRHNRSGKDENDNTYLQTPSMDDSSTSPSPSKLHKSPWNKMKDIIHTRKESVRKKRSSSKSPSESMHRRISVSDGGESDAPVSITVSAPFQRDIEDDIPPQHALRKQRSLELSPAGRPPPATRRQESGALSRWNKVKKVFLTSASVSVPSSPNRHSEFFNEFDDDDLPRCDEVKPINENSEVREEIQRDYAALQSKLRREFSDKRGKLSAEMKPVATEEQLSADFRKKLQEWQKMKNSSSGSGSGSTRQPPPIPDRADLSEEFLKKWDEWKRLKETNTVPAWGDEAKPEEVLVQTSTGLFRFQGISRSFTRKLHEWEKARGIAPEASTSALLQQARGRSVKKKLNRGSSLSRARSTGSVVVSSAAASLESSDAEDLELRYRDEDAMAPEGRLDLADNRDGTDSSRGAVLVEVEDEEVETASALYAASPRHAPHKPVYTYDQRETARYLCQTSSCAIGSTTLVQCDSSTPMNSKTAVTATTSSSGQRIQSKSEEMINQQIKHSKSKTSLASEKSVRIKTEPEEKSKNGSKKDLTGSNGKKKIKSRARLEREHSKPSESDSDREDTTVTVEIPKRRKKPRRTSERPKTPQDTDTDGEVFVLKLRTPEPKQGSPEVIVKTTRKIFSPVVRDGEANPRAVISVDVDELERGPYPGSLSAPATPACSTASYCRPPLPTSPSFQRRPPIKETAPSIRIMIQKYNKKLNDEGGHTSQGSSGTSSPAWRSPAVERRRPPDMPLKINIRNNPFIEREVQKSASASQLASTSRNVISLPVPKETVLNLAVPEDAKNIPKSSSADMLNKKRRSIKIKGTNIVNNNLTDSMGTKILYHSIALEDLKNSNNSVPVEKNGIEPSTADAECNKSTAVGSNMFSVSARQLWNDRFRSESESSSVPSVTMTLPSERTKKIRMARERFLSTPMAEERAASNDDQRGNQQSEPGQEPNSLGRSASAGMINVGRGTWERVARQDEGSSASVNSGRFSLSRLAAKFRKSKENTPERNSPSRSVISKLCRQSLLVQLKPQQ